MTDIEKTETTEPELCEFDLTRFGQVSLKKRINSDFVLWNFAKTGKNVRWPVQQLEAKDLFEMRQELAKVQKFEAILSGAGAAMLSKEEMNYIRGKLKKIVGDPNSIPPELTRMYVAFMRGSISNPDRSKTIKFAKHYPIEFQLVVNEIISMSEMGPDSKKKPSDYIKPIQKSETA